MMMPHPNRRLPRGRAAVLSICLPLFLLVTACESSRDPVVVGPDRFDPEIVDVRTTWIEEGWAGLNPVGTPGVQIFWELPDRWRDEVFRVYSRSAGSGDYFLIASVTSCKDRICIYTDTNVEAGRSYEYFIVAVDEYANRELGESTVWSVTVPESTQPAAPAGLEGVAMDGSVYLHWDDSEAARYRIFLEERGGEEVFFEIGSTDGTGFVDHRAENGSIHLYRIAAVDDGGYVSARSEAVRVVPRPDYHAELVYVSADSAAASGFRFTRSEDSSPVVAGDASDAQWRLDAEGDALWITPVRDTRVSGGVFTTDLTCGPGSEADCEYVAVAPGDSEFGAAPVKVSAGNTYVFQVTDEGRRHFAKVRVQGDAADSAGKRLIVLDWVFQLLPEEPNLRRGRVAP